MALPTLQQAILQTLDVVRSVAGILGLRLFEVTVTRRAWSGGRPGAPGASFVDVPEGGVLLTNLGADGNLYPVRVRQVSRAEAFASGGRYTNQDLKVGPMTPTFAATAFGPAGGFDDASIDPAPSAASVQMIWVVRSASGTFGIPKTGAVFDKRGEEATSLHYYAYLRSTGRAPT